MTEKLNNINKTYQIYDVPILYENHFSYYKNNHVFPSHDLPNGHTDVLYTSW